MKRYSQLPFASAEQQSQHPCKSGQSADQEVTIESGNVEISSSFFTLIDSV
jgi:hypothetical protein